MRIFQLQIRLSHSQPIGLSMRFIMDSLKQTMGESDPQLYLAGVVAVHRHI
jgi:hypothetical protein